MAASRRSRRTGSGACRRATDGLRDARATTRPAPSASRRPARAARAATARCHRPGGRGRRLRRARRAPRRGRALLRGVRGARRRRLRRRRRARRHRPDRRLDERQARAAAPRALDRRRRRPDDGRRRLRLRLRPRARRGVGRAPRRGRAAQRRAARPTPRSAARATAARAARRSSRPTRAGSRQAADALAETAHRVRAIGTIAVSLCQVAAARVDGMATLKSCRAVDAAAAQLIVRESGGHVAFPAFDDPLGAPLDLEPHSPVVAARTEPERPAPRSAWRRAGLPSWHVIDWRLAGPVARGRRHLQPAGDPAPSTRSRRPPTEARRLVRLHRPRRRAPVPPPRRSTAAGWIDTNLGVLRGRCSSPRRSASAATLGPLGAVAGGVLGARGRRAHRLPRPARARPVRVPHARARRARAPAVRRAEPRARRRRARRARRQLLRWVALHEITHALQFGGVPWLRDAPRGDLRRAARRDSSSTRAACSACPTPQTCAGSSSACARAGSRRSCSARAARQLDACRPSWPCSRATPSTSWTRSGRGPRACRRCARALDRRRRDRTGLLRLLER